MFYIFYYVYFSSCIIFLFCTFLFVFLTADMSDDSDIFAGIAPSGVSNQRTNGNSISPPLSTTTAMPQSPQPKRGKKRKIYPTTPNQRPNKSPRRVAPTVRFFTPQHRRRPEVQPQNFSQMPQHLTSEPQQQRQSNNSQLNDSNEQLFQQQQRQSALKLQLRLQSLQAQRLRKVRHVANQAQISNNSQQQYSQQSQNQQSQHIYITTYFNDYSNENKSILSKVFGSLSQDITDLKTKGIVVGIKFEILNSIIQSHRQSHPQSVFTDLNGEIKSLNFKHFVIDQYIGNQEDSQLKNLAMIKNLRDTAKYNYNKEPRHGIFSRLDSTILHAFETAIQSNVKYIFIFLYLCFF